MYVMVIMGKIGGLGNPSSPAQEKQFQVAQSILSTEFSARF